MTLQMSKASSEHLTVLLHAPGLRNSTGCRTTAPLTSSYIQGRSCRGQGRSCRGQGRSCRGQGRSCRQYWYAYVHTSYLRPCTCMYMRYCSSIYESDQGLVAAGYSILYIYIIGIAIKSIGTKAKNTSYLLALANFLSALYYFLNLLKIFF